MRAIILSLFIISLSFAKPVLLNIQKSGCGWCEKMNREIFENRAVMKKLKTKFRVIVLNRDIDKIPSVVRVHFFPTTFVLDENMTKVEDEILGYRSANDLLTYFSLF